MRRRIRWTWVLPTLAVLLSGCAKKPFNAERLKQEMPTYISYAAEAEFYVDYLSHGKSTATFASQHAEYLRQKILHSLRQLQKPDAAVRDDCQNVRDHLHAVAADLEEIASSPETVQLRRLRAQCSAHRAALEAIDSRL
jgi:hypothetical protein